MNKIESNESHKQISLPAADSIPNSQATSNSLLDTLQKIILAVKDFFVSIGEKISNFAKSISERIFSKETPTEPAQPEETSSDEIEAVAPITLENPSSPSFFSKAIEKTASYSKAFGQAVWNHKGKIGLGIAAAGALYFGSPYLFSSSIKATSIPKFTEITSNVVAQKCSPFTFSNQCFLVEGGKLIQETATLRPLEIAARARLLA